MYSLSTVVRPKLLGFAAMLALASAVTSQVLAIEPIGDNSELFVTGTASSTYNDNIFLSHNKATEDLIWDLAPGVSYEFGKTNSLTTGQLAANEDFVLYTKHNSHLGNQLFNGTFWTKYDDSKTKLNFDASYHQLDQAEVTIANGSSLIDRAVSHVDGMGEVQITEKSSVGTGIIFDETDYKQVGFSDWRYFQVPVNVYYKFEPKLDLSAGFQFTDNTLGSGGINSKVYYYNVGARGEFTPNLTGKFTVGYIEQQLDNGKNINGVGADSSFTYAYTAKTSFTAGLFDNFGYAASGNDYRDLGLYVGANTSLTEQWSANGQLSFNRYSYQTNAQRDDFYSARVGLSYLYSANVTISGSYTFSYDNSNITLDSFRSNLFAVSASLHF